MHNTLLAVTCFLLATAPALAGECEDVPPFIGMYGDWESVAVRADPPEILEVNADWTKPHPITGAPTAVCPGIEFIVEQELGGETVVAHLCLR